MRAAPDCPTWYCLQVRSHCEALVVERLVAAGIEAYTPKLRREVRHRRTKQWRLLVEPLFGGYAFVATDGSDWRQILSTKGVVTVLGTTGPDGEPVPSPLPPGVVDELRATQHAGKFDDTRAARKARNEHLDLRKLFPSGQAVRLSDGPFMGLAASVDGVNGNGSVNVLLNLLGRLTPVTARPEQLEAVMRRSA